MATASCFCRLRVIWTVVVACFSVFLAVEGGPVNGMRCLDGTILTGDTGPERTLTTGLICRFFFKFPWQYPPLGYKNEYKGVSYPHDCSRQMGGYVFSNPNMPTCPLMIPEEIHQRCLHSDTTKEMIRDMACVVKRDPAKLGRFLNNRNANRNKFELAAFFAHLGQETSDLRTMWENDGNAGQYCDYFYPGDNKYCTSDRLFFGRGVHQLTHPSNYADFSTYWYKDRTVLLENPEKILNDMETAWGSAIWFWMDPRQHHNSDPACTRTTIIHEALFDGLGFGQTISAINGGIECSGSNRLGPWQRIGRLIYFLDIQKISMPFFDGSVKVIPKWFTEGCSYIGTYKLKVSRASWKGLESNSNAGCKGFNQPYLCGWGGVTQGMDDVKRPLIAFDIGGGPIPDPSYCVDWETPQEGKNVWPHPLLKDEGYYPFFGMNTSSTSTTTRTMTGTTVPSTPRPTTTSTTTKIVTSSSTTTSTTTRPTITTSTTTRSTTTTSTTTRSSTSTSTSKPSQCNGCHISQLKNHFPWVCDPQRVVQFCSPPWDDDEDPHCCTRPDFESFANTQGCTCQ